MTSPLEQRKPGRILVVFYSRSGTTRRLAESIAGAAGADLEPLVDTVGRKGARGLVRSLRDAATHETTTLAPLGVDPTAYDLVVVGTPDWGGAVSVPVRTFLGAYAGRLRDVALFLTDGSGEHEAVFHEMAGLVRREPVACLGILHDEIGESGYDDKVEAFAEALKSGVAG